MKKNNLSEIKLLEVKEILARVNSLRKELADLEIDKNMKKMKDVKIISKKRKDVAQMLTIAGQKRLLKELEERSAKKGESKTV